MGCYDFWVVQRPSKFMRIMNQALRPRIEKFVAFYFDEILFLVPQLCFTSIIFDKCIWFCGKKSFLLLVTSVSLASMRYKFWVMWFLPRSVC